MPQTLPWGNTRGLDLKAVSLTTLMQQTNPIGQMFPGQLEIDTWSGLQDPVQMLRIPENLGLEWPTLRSTGPVHQCGTFTLSHGPQVLPFVQAILHSSITLFAHRPGSATGPDQLWLSRSPP